MATRLYPLMLLTDDLDAALDMHQLWYGNKPLHPLSGNWVWQAKQLQSPLFGNPQDPKLPIKMQDDDLFSLLKILDIGLRFENEGARIKLMLQIK